MAPGVAVAAGADAAEEVRNITLSLLDVDCVYRMQLHSFIQLGSNFTTHGSLESADPLLGTGNKQQGNMRNIRPNSS